MNTKLLLTGIAFIAFIGITAAQQNQTPQKTQTTQGAFVDTNNDGVCDNYTVTGKGQGQGLNKKQGNGQGLGQGLRKKDGSGQGIGNRQVKGKGLGRGGNFVDANKNGICDNRE
jgi:hypothetical protein